MTKKSEKTIVYPDDYPMCVECGKPATHCVQDVPMKFKIVLNKDGSWEFEPEEEMDSTNCDAYYYCDECV